jgi:hypothetical protein
MACLITTGIPTIAHPDDYCQHQGRGALLAPAIRSTVRLLVQVKSEDGLSPPADAVRTHGKGASGQSRVRRIGEDQFKWTPGLGRMTGRYVYSALERVEIYDLEPGDQITFYTAGYDGLFLGNLPPLWAGLVSEDHLALLLDETLVNPQRFWKTYGLPTCAQPPETPEAQSWENIHLPFNSLIGEGLVQYGRRQLAAELVSRLMNAVVGSLKREAAFRRTYSAQNGQGSGERNALYGLAPLSLFLEALGVRLISPSRVALAGPNPFPWPVTVKYRGLTILRQKDKTVVIFPDGQTVNIDDPTPQIVSLEQIS